jgi:hypothetical protein
VDEPAALGGEVLGRLGVVDEVDGRVDPEQVRVIEALAQPEVEDRRLHLRSQVGPGGGPLAEQAGRRTRRPRRQHHGSGLDLMASRQRHGEVAIGGVPLDRGDGGTRPDLCTVAAGRRRQRLDHRRPPVVEVEHVVDQRHLDLAGGDIG